METSRGQRRDGEQGAVATEFALILPLLVILFFGIVQVGLAVWRAQVVEAAAREGARVAAVGGTDSDIKDAVRAAATGFLASELTISPQECTDLDGDTIVEVVASGDRLDYNIPFVGPFTPTFEARAIFECEALP